MILDSMTQKEIIDIFSYDYKRTIVPKIEALAQDNRYRRYMLSHRTENLHCFLPIDLTTKSKTTYIIQIKSMGFSDWKKNGFVFIIYMIYLSKHGLQAVMIDNTDKGFSFYSSHLFDRYIERFLGNGCSKKDAIVHFFQNNAIFQASLKPSKNHPECVFATISDGVLLGEQPLPEIISFSTFISNEQLKNDQIEKNNENISIMADYLLKTYGLSNHE